MEERSPLAVEIIANKQDIFRIILLVAAGDAAVVQLNLNRSPYSPKGPCADKIVTLQLIAILILQYCNQRLVRLNFPAFVMATGNVFQKVFFANKKKIQF